MKRIASGTLIFVVLFIGIPLAQQKVGWSTGYYSSWDQGNFPPSNINWDAFTHVCQFAITPTATGGISQAGLNDAYCQAAVAEAHKNGRKILICVGGAGTGSNFVGASNATNRSTFIANIISYMQKFGYDGVDMDWEELNGANASYVALHKELREELNKLTPRPLLTVAMADYLASVCGQIYSYVDQMNAMSYWTTASQMGGFMSPLLNAGIPKSILGVGMGLDPADNELDTDSSSCRKKCEYAIANGYGGVMAWDLSGAQSKQLCYMAIAKFVPAPIPTGVNNFIVPSFKKTDFSMTLSQNNGLYQIYFTIPPTSADENIFTDISMYTMRGSLIHTLQHGNTAPGTYQISINPKHCTGSGPCIIKLSTNAGGATLQTTMIK